MFIVNAMSRQTSFEIQTMLTKSRLEMLMGIRTPISNSLTDSDWKKKTATSNLDSFKVAKRWYVRVRSELSRYLHEMLQNYLIERTFSIVKQKRGERFDFPTIAWYPTKQNDKRRIYNSG